MEISSFAEQLLFGSNLSDKLWIPQEGFSDEKPSICWNLPDFPSRPKELQLKPKELRESFPSLKALEQDKWARGAVIHFFANHELLAIEIMALTLLRFPDAPKDFRKSLVHTILEEQEHMVLYQERMENFGIGLGEIAVNDFFWKCCKDLTSPRDVLLALSLTFEQANLDYSQFYTQQFQKIDDQETVAVLQKVYLDEIGHVENGVKWLSRWKDPKEKLWSHFITNLPKPLTPERAKGMVFDKEGRTKAGLSEDFQNELLHFGHSKGKLPDVWCFRPGGEWEVSSGKRPKATIDLQRDLGTLPFWMAGPDDLILLKETPSALFLDHLLQFRNRLPESKTLDVLENWKGRNTSALEPWTWTEIVYSSWEKVLQGSAHWQQTRIENIKDDFSYGLHRQRTVELEAILKQEFSEDWIVFGDPMVCSAKEFKKNHAFSDDWVAKAVHSSSGHGVFFFKTEAEFDKIPFLQDVEILFEKKWNRICDLSFLFDALPSGEYQNRDITQFYTRASGVYAGHVVGPYSYNLSSSILRLLHQKIGDKTRISILQRKIREALPSLWEGYRGPVGVDAMVVEVDGVLKFRPLVEVNFRRTMGHYSMALKKWIDPKKVALFQICPKAKWSPTGYTLKKAKLSEGEMELTDYHKAKRFMATLKIVG